jgi:hypothetical protein
VSRNRGDSPKLLVINRKSIHTFCGCILKTHTFQNSYILNAKLIEIDNGRFIFGLFVCSGTLLYSNFLSNTSYFKYILCSCHMSHQKFYIFVLQLEERRFGPMTFFSRLPIGSRVFEGRTTSWVPGLLRIGFRAYYQLGPVYLATGNCWNQPN